MRSFSLWSLRFREKPDLILSLSKDRFFARRSKLCNLLGRGRTIGRVLFVAASV